MVRNARRQVNGVIGRSFVRSPALESVKLERVVERSARGKEVRAGQQRRALPASQGGHPIRGMGILPARQVSPSGRGVSTRATRPTPATMGKMRYAAVEPVERGGVARRPLKTLPRRGRVSAAVKLEYSRGKGGGAA